MIFEPVESVNHLSPFIAVMKYLDELLVKTTQRSTGEQHYTEHIDTSCSGQLRSS